MRFLTLVFLLVATQSFGQQYKDYILGVKGDTLNIVDMNGQKQGKWVVRFDQIRGEPGYEEEGMFINNRKEGVWRRYSLVGDLVAVENYRWGYKDGVSQYFNGLGELMREESWRAINPDKQFDTLDVEDVDRPGNYKSVIVKNEGAAVKHGPWKYYDPVRGTISKTENYVIGSLETGKKEALSNETLTNTTEKKPKAKPKEVLEFEKKNAGKKKVTVRDGGTL